MDTNQKLIYFETLVQMIHTLYVDQNTDTALRQRAKEEAEKVMDSLSAELATSEMKPV